MSLIKFYLCVMSNTNVEKAVVPADSREKYIAEEEGHAPNTDRGLTEAPKDELPTQEKSQKEDVKDTDAKKDATKEKDEKEKPSWRHTCYWVSLALLAGFNMGTGSFIYASNFSGLGIVGTGTYAPGGFLFYVLVKIGMLIKSRIKTGAWINPANSTVVYPDGKIRWTNLIPLIANTVTNGAYLVILTYAWAYAKRGGLNQGIISTFLSFASVINIGLFYCFFKEKVTVVQVIGIVIMIGCIVCLSFETSQKGEEDLSETNEDEEYDYSEGPSKLMSCVYALILASFAPWTMSIKQVFIRMYMKEYPPLLQGLDSMILEYGLFCIGTILLVKDEEFYFTWRVFGIGAVAGIMIGLGRIFVAMAVAVGIAAAVQALMSTHALHQTLWSTIVDGQSFTTLQALGLMFGLLGVFTLSAVNYFVEQAIHNKNVKAKAAEK